MESISQIELNNITYIGPSMNPTLKSGDRLCVSPCDGQRIQRGDVVVLISPEDGSRVVHRVVSSNPSGIRTRGDNNNQCDPWVLSPDNIVGCVVSLRRGNRRLRVFGGLLGHFYAIVIRAINIIDLNLTPLLRPFYQRLARAGVCRRWLPRRMRPRVISFNRDEGTELQLVMGQRVIGRWLEGKSGWNIRRPFRLFVDEETLPGNPGKGFVVPPEADPSSVANEDL